jgi:hypothetical protein
MVHFLQQTVTFLEAMALFVWENLMIDCQAWGYPKGTTIKAMKTEGHECPT